MKVKLIFYGVLVFSIYLIAIIYSFGNHRSEIIHKSTNLPLHVVDYRDERDIRIKFTVMNRTGELYRNTVILIENKHKKKQDKEKPLAIKTNGKGEFELTIESGTYLFYLEQNPVVQQQVSINFRDKGKKRKLEF